MFSCETCTKSKNTFFYRTPSAANLETKHTHASTADLLRIRFGVSIGIRAMRKKLNIFMVQLLIYYILELEISVGTNADIAKMKREK